MQELDKIRNQSELEKLGITYDDIINGEVAGLENIDVKTAKKTKDPIVRQADADVVIEAYHKDLANAYTTLESLAVTIKEVTEEKEQKVQEVNKLSTQLNQLDNVENKIKQVSSLCSTIESSLVTLKTAKAKHDAEIRELNKELDEKKERLVELNTSIDSLQDEKDAARAELDAVLAEKETKLADLSKRVQSLIDEFYAKLNGEIIE